MDLSNGLMSAVPVKAGKAPTIDGDLKDFDLSGAEPAWISTQTIGQYNANLALMYDEDALYLGARLSLPNRDLHNPNNPIDAFWNGDVLELRLASDPSLPAPLDPADARVKSSKQIIHITLWKNSESGKDYAALAYGVDAGNPIGGKAVNPAPMQLVIKQQGRNSYTIEARIPWAVLNVPGGKNPFAPGQKMTAVWSPHWGGENQTPALYRTNPGSFAFMQPATWGQVEFAPTGDRAPRHETLEQLIARYSQPAPVATMGVPIQIRIPAPAKVSVNIFGPHGEVLRELMGGEPQPKGLLTVRWDGKDQWGNALKPGSYRWGAYLSNGLKAKFVGGVGKSGDPYFETPDGKGAWGGDHSDPLDVAADPSGLYFLWPVAESGKSIVKTDYSGRVLWRKTPFVGGGFGPIYALASDSRYVYAIHESDDIYLLRLDAATGQLIPFGESATVLIEKGNSIAVPADSTPILNGYNHQPESVGLATNGREIFVPIFSRNVIRVLNPESGAFVREIACPAPRGLCLDARGDLFAVSYVQARPQIVRFADATGAAQTVVSRGLVAPWDVAVDATGQMFVSDLGTSQQIKVFSAGGKLLDARGKLGGRTRAGAYDPKSFLHPAGVATDAQNGLLVAESSTPRVISRFASADGRLLKRWFGAPVYWNGTWPDPQNPRVVFYQLHDGFARATLPQAGGSGLPDAYWTYSAIGREDAGDKPGGEGIPEVLIATNGKKYYADDSAPHAVALMEGDQVRVVGHARPFGANWAGNTLKKNYIELWSDLNGDGVKSADEVTIIDSIGGQPLPEPGAQVGSMTMTPNGDLFLLTSGNKILKIPALGFLPNGAIRWNAGKTSVAVPVILPSRRDFLPAGWRGEVGIRVDSKGAIYTAFSADVPGQSAELAAQMAQMFPGLPPEKWGAFATPELAAKLKTGLSHTAESNAVKFAKFDANGQLLWMAGRKATAAAHPGEMYQFWSIGGLVNDRYISGASEWGPITFYTSDGFYVDSLMNNPGFSPPPGPYTFGSETGGARVRYFPRQDQVWAYEVGMAYQIEGFKNGVVEGEKRLAGTVQLDKTYENAPGAEQNETLHIARLGGNPLADSALWNAAPVSTLRRNGNELATAQLGIDDANLYVRLHVRDDSPGQNSADGVATAFKGGDTAGVVLGRAPHDEAQLGDVRLMVAPIGGVPHLIAMKAISAQQKHPEDYFTPAGGHARFDFVGEVPGGKVQLVPDANGRGYTATFSVPRSFLEFDLKPGSITGDIEMRLSGNGPRGIQATSRNYLFTPLKSETTLTDDVPTEARLYPRYWGKVEVQ